MWKKRRMPWQITRPRGKDLGKEKQGSMNSKQGTVSAEAQGLYKLFNPGQPTGAEYDGTTLRIIGGNHRSLRNEDIANISLDLRRLHHAIILTLKNGNIIELSGFKEQTVRSLHAAVSSGVARQRAEELKEQAHTLETSIRDIHPMLPSLLPTGVYIRDSHCRKAAPRIQQVTARCTPEVVKELSPSAGKMLKDIRNLEALVTSETKRREANQKFIRTQAELAKQAVEHAEQGKLTKEQAEAVATDEDVTLVAAGAGTGKTTVITAKLAHLVANQKVKPDRILVLAYNNNAAVEIRERLRLAPELEAASVDTFHAFGRRVIGQTSEMPSVSTLAEPFQLRRAMQAFIEEMTKDEGLSRALLNFTINMPAQYRSPFDPEIHTQADYQKYIVNSRLLTLNGEIVKSFEELTIANWLAANDIEYQYEKPYEQHTATTQYRQYHPDFYLPHHQIYIEHFALNREGKAPPGWIGYEKGVEWKRKLHQSNQTKLVETYSWQHREGTLLPELGRTLDELQVEQRRIPTEELIKQLGAIRITRLAELLVAFLNHTKSGNITQEQIDVRASVSQDPRRTGEFLKLWRYARERYEERLQQEGTIDFHDMINEATAILTRGEWTHNYTHVLVDEFQDISAGRMALIKALMQNGMAYFLVGDDWQSIYRFTGSQVRLFNEVHEYLGFTERVTLSQTFRFGNDIAQPSARFIQQNPDQTQRTLRGADHLNDSTLTVIADSDQKQGARTALDQIRSQRTSEDTTLILGRFQRSRENLPSWAQKHFSTIHSAKGKEAEHVIVLDLADDIYGFPCLREDDPLLDLVAPPIDDNPYPYAEERRLFYVGMTRSKKATYLVADPSRPSPFIRELLQIAPEVRELGQLSPECPACRAGHLVRSQTGHHLRCTNHPACEHLAPRCTACRQGYAVVSRNNRQEATETRCTNEGCQHTERVCPRCRQGLLTIRTNTQTDNKFWACSEWRGGTGCTFTEEVSESSQQGQPRLS